MEEKIAKNSQESFKGKQGENLLYQVSELVIKIKSQRQCGISVSADKQINRTETKKL